MREACDEYALWLVGGDLSRGREVSIAVTVTGEVAPGKAVLRSGAAPRGPVGRHRRPGWERRGFAAHAPADDAGRAAARLGAPPPPPVRTRGGGRRAGTPRRHRHDRRVGRARARPLPLGASQRGRGAPARSTTSPWRTAPRSTTRSAAVRTTSCWPTVPDAGAVEAARIELKEAFGVNLTDIGEIVEGADLTTVGRDGTEHPARTHRLGPLPMTHRRASTARAHDRRLATPAAARASRPTSRRSARSACTG